MSEKRMEAADRLNVPTPSGALTIVVALFLTAIVVIVYWIDRLYRGWWKANEPFAATRARIARTRTTYQERRASLAETLGLAWEVFTDIDRARGQAGTSDRPQGG